ncbi:MAG: hypothetical protein AAFV47_13150 [Pseudomonadota bacterium]
MEGRHSDVLELLPSELVPLWWYWERLARLPYLAREVDLDRAGPERDLAFGVSAGNAAMLAEFIMARPNLRSVGIDGVYVPQALLNALRNCEAIRKLDLAPIRSDLGFLSELASLEVLRIESTSNDDFLRDLEALPRLRSLSIGLRSGSLSCLGVIQSGELEVLVIEPAVKSKRLTISSLNEIEHHKKLSYLIILGAKLEESAVESLLGMNLELLVVGSSAWIPANQARLLAASGVTVLDSQGQPVVRD